MLLGFQKLVGLGFVIALVAVAGCKKGNKCTQQGIPCGSGHGVYTTKTVSGPDEDPCICRCQGNWEWDDTTEDCECSITQADCPDYTKLDPVDCECLPGVGIMSASLSGSQVSGTIQFAPSSVVAEFDQLDSTFVINGYNVEGQEYLELRIPHAMPGTFNTNINMGMQEFFATHRLSADNTPFTIREGEITLSDYAWFTEAEGTFTLTLEGPQGVRNFINGSFEFSYPQ